MVRVSRLFDWIVFTLTASASSLQVFASTAGIVYGSSEAEGETCPCPLLDRPDRTEKEKLARWMVHSLDWGVLSTINSRIPGRTSLPFGNVYSFVDGPCDKSTGIPYFYGTYMDSSFQDIQVNPVASFTLSEASFSSVCGSGKGGLAQCSVSNHHNYHHMVGDPESPVCARLTLSGHLVEVPADSDEYATALQAFYHRHEQMADWPTNHNWVIAKLVLEDIWFIDYFGGPTIIPIDKYLATDIIPPKEIIDSD